MLFDRCRIEKDLTVELQKMEFMSKMNLLCYDNLLLSMFMKKHVQFPTGLYVARY